MSTEAELVKASFGRCITKGLMDVFYDHFLKSSPKIGPMFAKTDMKTQKHTLKQGLNLCLMWYDGLSIGKSGIDRIRDTHQRSKMNIPPDLYPYWKQSLLTAVSECDPLFDKATGKAWDTVLQKTIDYIASGY